MRPPKLQQSQNLHQIALDAVEIFRRMLRQSGIQNILNNRFLEIENQKLRAIQQKISINARNQILLREILGQLSQTFMGIANEIRDYDVKNRDQLQQLIDVIRGNQDRSQNTFEEAVKYLQKRDQQQNEFQQKQLDQMQQLISLLRSQQLQQSQQTQQPQQPSFGGQIPNGSTDYIITRKKESKF
jgi:hypothetical protein